VIPGALDEEERLPPNAPCLPGINRKCCDPGATVERKRDKTRLHRFIRYVFVIIRFRFRRLLRATGRI
jgi:hypothetical protein